MLKDQKVLVVGLGRSGIATVNSLLDKGAKVTIQDQKKPSELIDIKKQMDSLEIEWILGEKPKDIKQFNVLVLSPGVPTDLDFIQDAKRAGILVIGELELAYRLCEGTFIGITGTNGKTTTTALTGEIFEHAKKDAYVVGNIGVAAISKAQQATKDSYMITEISSFQLETIIDFHPRVAAILNITPDHLNRHKTMENYIKAKANIFKNQTEDDFLILNKDNALTCELKDLTDAKVIFFSRKEVLKEGIYVEDNKIIIKEDHNKKMVLYVDELNIPGDHNLENALAAVGICYYSGIQIKDIAYVLRRFMGVEHRIEFVDEIGNIKFINDSKGTNPDASIRAVEAMKTPIVLIAGGMDKGSEFDTFIESFKNKVRHVVLLGETADKIEKACKSHGFLEYSRVKNMKEAVECSVEYAKEGDCVLLSPACASWDMYPSFEVRGKHFKQCVQNLKGE